MDYGGVIIGYAVAAIIALAGIVGLFTGKAIGASYSDGMGVVTGDAALTHNIVYILLGLLGAAAIAFVSSR